MKTLKPRSGIILAAQMRRGGPMRDKRSKRAEENKNPDFHEELESEYHPTRAVSLSWITVHHAIEMLQMQAEQWVASADAWKTLNELRESLGMKSLIPIDLPKWPDYFELENE